MVVESYLLTNVAPTYPLADVNKAPLVSSVAPTDPLAERKTKDEFQ